MLKIIFISSIHEDVTPDKFLNEKSKCLSEILMILVSKPEDNYSLFCLYTTQTVIFHMEVMLNALQFLVVCTVFLYLNLKISIGVDNA